MNEEVRLQVAATGAQAGEGLPECGDVGGATPRRSGSGVTGEWAFGAEVPLLGEMALVGVVRAD